MTALFASCEAATAPALILGEVTAPSARCVFPTQPVQLRPVELMPVSPAPLPLKDAAVTLPLAIMLPATSSFCVGLAVPIPTLPLVKIAAGPVPTLLALKAGPTPWPHVSSAGALLLG